MGAILSTPICDKVFRIDAVTNHYTGYKEFVPGSVILPPDQFLERRFQDVLPTPVADLMDRAIYRASRYKTPTKFACAMFRKFWDCDVVPHGNYVSINSSVRQKRRR